MPLPAHRNLARPLAPSARQSVPFCCRWWSSNPAVCALECDGRKGQDKRRRCVLAFAVVGMEVLRGVAPWACDVRKNRAMCGLTGNGDRPRACRNVRPPAVRQDAPGCPPSRSLAVRMSKLMRWQRRTPLALRNVMHRTHGCCADLPRLFRGLRWVPCHPNAPGIGCHGTRGVLRPAEICGVLRFMAGCHGRQPRCTAPRSLLVLICL